MRTAAASNTGMQATIASPPPAPRETASREHLAHTALHGGVVGAQPSLALLAVAVVAVDDGACQRVDVDLATAGRRRTAGTTAERIRFTSAYTSK